MNFGQAISAGFRNYVVFTGRASHSEYWYWFLFVSLVRIAVSAFTGNGNGAGSMSAHMDINPCGALASSLASMALPGLWNLATFLPTLGVTIRRLRDAGYNPKVLLWSIAPFVLSILTLFVGVAAVFSGPSIADSALYDNLARFAPVIVVGSLTAAVSLGIGIWFIVMLTKPSKATPTFEINTGGMTA